MASLQLERVHLTALRGYIPTICLNPLTGQVLPTRAGESDRLVEGTLVHVLKRDFQTSTTTFIRSLDHGRTWCVYEAHELLKTTREPV